MDQRTWVASRGDGDEKQRHQSADNAQNAGDVAIFEQVVPFLVACC